MAAHDKGIDRAARSERGAGYNGGVTILEPEINAWLRAELPAANTHFTVTALAAEASFRQFYRLRSDSGQWILMDSPPDKERNAEFCELAGIFGQAGLPVPKILARQDQQGWFLLSDLGERDFETAYREGDTKAALSAAIDALATLQQISDVCIAPYTEQRFADELGIFTEWFLQRLLGASLPGDLQDSFEVLVARTQQQPQCCVHRDFHCRNLLLSPGGELGIVDFQDALIGPAAYDLASLLHDCYHEFPEPVIAEGCSRYLQHPDSAVPASYGSKRFRTDLDFCAVQRQLKAIGIFARLAERDNKRSHLRYISPLLRRLSSLCAGYRELTELGGYLGALAERESAWQS